MMANRPDIRKVPVVLPGATLAGIAQSPDVQIFEQLYSCEPNEAWFSPARSVANPTSAEVGAYQVPKDQLLLVTDFSFNSYVPSDVGAALATPIDSRMLRGAVGFSFSIRGKLPGVAQFNLEPVPSTTERIAFRPPLGRPRRLNEVTTGDFARKAAAAYSSAAGTGRAMLPPREWRHGDRNIPGAFLVTDSDTVVLSMRVYRPIPFPLAFIEGRILGYVGPRSVLDKLIKDLQDPLR